VVRDYTEFLAGPGRDLFTPAGAKDGGR